MTSRNPATLLGSRPWLALAVGGAVRVAWLLSCPNEPISDQAVYHAGAKHIAAGAGFMHYSGDPIGYWPVGYSAFLAGFYSLFGPTFSVAFVANAIAGTFGVYAAYLLGRELYDEQVGTMSAWGMALYPTFILGTTLIASETLYIPLLLSCVYILVRAARATRHGARWAAGAAVMLAATAMVRPTALIFPLTLFLAGLLWGRGLRRTLLTTFAVSALAVMLMVPWGLRNQAVFDRFSITSFNGGSILWMGNHEGADGSVPEDRSLYEPYDGLSVPEKDARLREVAIDFIVHNPGRFLYLAWLRTRLSLRAETINAGWNTVGIEATFGPGSVLVFKIITTLGYYAVAALFLFALGYKALRSGFRRADALMLLCVALGAVPFVVMLGMDRYHLPVIPFATIVAASALSEALAAYGSRDGVGDA